MTFDRFRIADSEFHDKCQFVNEKNREIWLLNVILSLEIINCFFAADNI